MGHKDRKLLKGTECGKQGTPDAVAKAKGSAVPAHETPLLYGDSQTVLCPPTEPGVTELGNLGPTNSQSGKRLSTFSFT